MVLEPDLPEIMPEAVIVPLWRAELRVRQLPTESATALPGRPGVAQPWRKLGYFLWREGFRLTLRKVLATRRLRDAHIHNRLELVIGRRDGERGLWWAIANLSAYTSAPLRVSLELIGRLPEKSPDVLGMFLQKQLETKLDATTVHCLCEYSTFSGRPLPAAALAAINREVTAIAAGDAESESGRNRNEELSAEPEVPRERHEPHEPHERKGSSPPRTDHRAGSRSRTSGYDLVLVGAGAYPQCYVLPELRSARRTVLIEQHHGTRAVVARRYGFTSAFARLEDAVTTIAQLDNPVGVVVSYHATHLSTARELRKRCPGIPLMIEKPPIVRMADLKMLEQLLEDGQATVGYNRRFAPFVLRMKELLNDEIGPFTLSMDVKEVPLLPNHWYYWPNQGTRLAANLCHWIDLAIYLVNQPVDGLHAMADAGDTGLDRVGLSLRFADGSIANLMAAPEGDSLRGVQEQILVRRGVTELRLDDFCTLRWRRGGRSFTERRRLRDKGHAQMYRSFEAAVLGGVVRSIPIWQVREGTRTYLSAMQLLLAQGRSAGESGAAELADPSPATLEDQPVAWA